MDVGQNNDDYEDNDIFEGNNFTENPIDNKSYMLMLIFLVIFSIILIFIYLFMFNNDSSLKILNAMEDKDVQLHAISDESPIIL